HGEVVGVVNTSETTTHELARMMVGREVLFRVDKKAITPGETVIEVKNLSAFDDRGLLALDDISLNIKAGEIVGIAGVQGNGQSELVETLTGLRKVENGEIVIGGVDYTDSTPREILKVGVAHIPEDRQRRGLVLNFSLKENVILGLHYYPEYSNYTVFANERVEEFTKLGIKTFEIKVADLDTPISTMSGGNQQKIILARELLGRNPKLIIAAQPTRGLDVGVIEYVHKILIQMCGQGLAILLISTELDEIRSLADRAFVLFKGKFMAEVDPKTISDEDISLLMAGESLEGKN
ncbi:MAG: ATP-binding cassette domain-containing protein, partial [Candidatus Hodarchaeota archaeon]